MPTPRMSGSNMSRFGLPVVMLGVLACSFLFFHHWVKVEIDAQSASLAQYSKLARDLQNELHKGLGDVSEDLAKKTMAHDEVLAAQAIHLKDISNLALRVETIIKGQVSEADKVSALIQGSKELEERVDGQDGKHEVLSAKAERQVTEHTNVVSLLGDLEAKHGAMLSSVQSKNDNMATTIADLQAGFDGIQGQLAGVDGMKQQMSEFTMQIQKMKTDTENDGWAIAKLKESDQAFNVAIAQIQLKLEATTLSSSARVLPQVAPATVSAATASVATVSAATASAATVQTQAVLLGDIAATQKDIDWQIWVDVGEMPFVRKIVITYKQQLESPQYSAVLKTFTKLDQVPENTFTFNAPEGAKKIPLLPLEKDTGDASKKLQ